MTFTPAIAVHGGAGTISESLLSDNQRQAYHQVLADAVKSGYDILQKGGHAVEAVTAAVVVLEDCPLFNAGCGSVFNHDGKHEMDASIMRGDTNMAGAVAAVRNIRNPVMAARAVMEHSPHVMLAADGAEQFAMRMGLKFEKDEYFFNDYRYRQWLELKDTLKTQLDHSDRKFGTVGSVAIDRNGNLAAATSTGGMTNKQSGRIGDTPLIGAGTYASNRTCAVSCTGDGEFFIRSVVAYDVACLMQYKGLSLKDACSHILFEKLKQSGGEGGLIAVDSAGEVILAFNTSGMYRAVMKKDKLFTAIHGGKTDVF